MARTPLLPQSVIQPLFEIYPDLPQLTQCIHPQITNEELQSPKDPIKYFLLSYVFLAAASQEKIQKIIFEQEKIQNFCFDIELSDLLSPESQAACGIFKSIPLLDFQEYLDQMHKQQQQQKQELLNDEEVLKKLSADLEETLKKHRENLQENAKSLHLDFDKDDMNHVFRIYDELTKRTTSGKLAGLNQLHTNQATSLAEQLLNPNSDLAKICEYALTDLSRIKENFYNTILIKYFKRLVQRYERMQALKQQNPYFQTMSWIKQAFASAEDVEKNLCDDLTPKL